MNLASADKTTNFVQIEIAERTYQINCPIDKLVELQQSAEYLNNKMRNIRESTHVNPERIAVMAALNITREYLSLLKNQVNDQQLLEDITQKLKQALEQAA